MKERSADAAGPPPKRSKSSVDADDADDAVDAVDAHADDIQRAWDHYRNFVVVGESDSDGPDDDASGVPDVSDDETDHRSEGEAGGDVDELLELIEILTANEVTPLTVEPSADGVVGDDDDDADQPSLFHRVELLIPILLSMSCLHLASHAAMDGESDDSSPEYWFRRSLQYWTTNPAAHMLLANYYRMNMLSSTDDIAKHYDMAADYAFYWRKAALHFLQLSLEDVVTDGVDAKEWVSLLVLNGALKMDYADGEDDDEGTSDQDEECSISEVEATASFMAAFLLSVLSKHHDALLHLKKFKLSHRIHPNVWKEAQKTQQRKGNSKTDDHEKGNLFFFPPRMYQGSCASTKGSNGLLPPDLYQRLCTLFSPHAAYWNQSDYNNRGYYSYFLDLDAATDSSPSVRECPTNVIEDVIVNHLLPMAERTLKENSDSAAPCIVGAEWWVHTRPLGANLGHQIHFDTDEALLRREKRVSHPIISSVLYLTGDGEGAGSTVVFDQTPESEDVASRAWISRPKNNAFMTFPGNLLHGVLPCVGASSEPRGSEGSGGEEVHRLTFMVGFWTRNVTNGMGERPLYSPVGPLPPASCEHSWVLESKSGYDDMKKKSTKGKTKDDAFDYLPSASPAWEKIFSNAPTNTSGPGMISIPRGMDHRFFVFNAPQCFSESLLCKEGRS